MPSRDRAEAMIAVTDLSVAYGATEILKALSLGVPKGAFTALVGPNGCGKSTLLRTMAGLLRPRRGTVTVDGRAIASLPSKAAARLVGLLPQGPVAPEGLTVEDLVRQGRYPHRSLFARWSPADGAACEEALRMTGLAALRGRPIDSLSGGQRQRAWIAMTLAQQTQILLLDEPTTFLDLAHQIEILDLVRDLVENRGTTVVAVLHDVNQAGRYADRLVMMKDGVIEAAGPVADVVTADMIARVFGVRADVSPNPVDGTPLVLPLATRRR